VSDYLAILDEIAAKYNVPRDQARAIFELETRSGRYNRTSPAGAQGLMQLMPGTARDMGVTDINDPRQNITGGLKYYAQQLQRFKDPALAAAAYNAGPGAVAKAGGVPNFRETRRYVADFRNMIQPKAAPPAPTPAIAAAPTGPSMDEADPADETPNFAVAPQNDFAAYLKTSDEIAERKAALRKEQFERNTALLDKMYAGPSRSQQLFALSQAFLQPINTGGGGFAQVLGNVTGALGATSAQMREAQQKRAMAAAQLQDTYAMQGVEGDEERAKRQFEILKLLREQRPIRSAISPQTDRVINLDTGEEIVPPAPRVGSTRRAGGRSFRFVGGDQYDKNSWQEF
jgi:hypothetical protein